MTRTEAEKEETLYKLLNFHILLDENQFCWHFVFCKTKDTRLRRLAFNLRHLVKKLLTTTNETEIENIIVMVNRVL